MTYQNPLHSAEDLTGWIAEGPVRCSADGASITLSSSTEDEHGHWTLWCPEVFGDRIKIEWEFSPVREPGLAMMFFAATGTSGRDLFSNALAHRDGHYPQYHSGDISTLHLSYLRHKWPEERAFRTCNLRKSPGFHLATQAADPLPTADDADGFYAMTLIKNGAAIDFSINGLPVLSWIDDGTSYGPGLGAGRIGFRQMAPLVARYRNLKIAEL